MATRGFRDVDERLRIARAALVSISRMVNALDSVSHHDEQTGPVQFAELPERSHDARMNPLLVWLTKAHDQNAVVRLVAMFRETLVRRDERAPLGLGKRPEFSVEHPLALGATNIENVVPHAPKFLNGDVGDVLIHQNSHEMSATLSNGVTCSSASEAA